LAPEVHGVNISDMTEHKAGYHHGDLRNALVEQAVELVESAGPESFSLREAARVVGVTPNAAYRHFADKSDLLVAVAAHGFVKLGRKMQRRSAAVDERDPRRAAVARFEAVGRAYVDFAVAHSNLFRVMFGLRGLACVVGADPIVARPTPFDLLAASIDAMVSAGALDPSRRAGAELKAWSVVHGFASLVVEGGAPMTAAERGASLDALLAFALAGLGARVDGAARAT
jgi:AcrR family transcriptional regulator